MSSVYQLKRLAVLLLLPLGQTATAQTHLFQTSGDSHSKTLQSGSYTVWSIEGDKGVVASIVANSTTVASGVYGEVVAFQNEGKAQLDVDASQVCMKLADGTLISAMNAAEYEKMINHLKKKQFWSDVANEGVTRLNANSAKNLGADQTTQSEIVVNGTLDQKAGDKALLQDIDEMSAQRFTDAGLQNNEVVSWRVYFRLPKDSQNFNARGHC